VASELDPAEGALDGRALEAVAQRGLAGARGAVFTAAPEARILAAFALAHAAARRGGPHPAAGVAALLGPGAPPPALRAALDGLVVLDPACGAGALLAAAEILARRVGARLRLRGLELAPLAARASVLRLALLGASAEVDRADALVRTWPACDLLLANPPFVRHESLGSAEKARAARRTGLARQADLAAHFALLSLRWAPVAGLVWPRALSTSRYAAPVRAEARARGGMALWLRSRASGSFAASVDTALAVWVEGGAETAPAEAAVPLAELGDAELGALARGSGSPRLRIRREPRAAAGRAGRVDDVCAVRFGVKTGCNAFFHLRPSGAGTWRSALAGEVRLAPSDVAPLLSGLKEALAPERAEPRLALFRPARPGAAARAYVAAGEALGVHRRPTCAGRSPWWRLAPGRGPAPVLYPAKVGARAFAFHNSAGLWEDKKWHALFPRGVEPWALAAVLSSTPVRLAIDRAARQLTGAQAIADIDCGVLAAAPFPDPAAIRAVAAELRAVHAALARDPVTTDLAAMLDRAAQRELDLLAGRALGLPPAEVRRARRELLDRVRHRLEHAAGVRRAIRTRA
jgi:hypothetical protein